MTQTSLNNPTAECAPRVSVAASSRGSAVWGAHASRVLFSALRRKPHSTNFSTFDQLTMSVYQWFGRDARTRTRDACAPLQSALRSGAQASARFIAQTFVVSKTNSHVANIRPLKRRPPSAVLLRRTGERRAPVAMPLSLTPGFSPVWHVRGHGKLFQQFSRAPKPLKRFLHPHRHCTGLKPDVNERKLSGSFQFLPPCDRKNL